MWQEFRRFLMRGNVLELAIGIVIGVAFGKIISSFVSDILMPPIGLLLGRVDFSNLFIDLSGRGAPTLAAAKELGSPTLNYGLFINNIIEFVIIASAVFLVVKSINKLQSKQGKGQTDILASPPSQELVVLGEIRDILRQASAADERDSKRVS